MNDTSLNDYLFKDIIWSKMSNSSKEIDSTFVQIPFKDIIWSKMSNSSKEIDSTFVQIPFKVIYSLFICSLCI